MQELIDLALDVARTAGAGYADIRIVERATESLTVKNGNLAEASSNRSAGFGVRVLRRRGVGICRQLADGAGRGGAHGPRGGGDRAGQRPGHARADRARRLAGGRRGLPHPVSRGPVRGPARREAAPAVRGRCGHGQGRGRHPANQQHGVRSRAQDLRIDARAPASSRRSSTRGRGSRRWPSTSTRSSAAATRSRRAASTSPAASRRFGTCSSLDHAQRIAEEAVALLDAPSAPRAR